MEQMKEQGKNSPDQTNGQETGKLQETFLSEKDFRVIIVKICKILEIEWKK